MRRNLLIGNDDTEALTGHGGRGSLINSSNEVSSVDCDADSKMRRLNILLDSDLHKALRVRTVIEGKSMSAVIKDALKAHFDKKDSVKRSEDV